LLVASSASLVGLREAKGDDGERSGAVIARGRPATRTVERGRFGHLIRGTRDQPQVRSLNPEPNAALDFSVDALENDKSVRSRRSRSLLAVASQKAL